MKVGTAQQAKTLLEDEEPVYAWWPKPCFFCAKKFWMQHMHRYVFARTDYTSFSRYGRMVCWRVFYFNAWSCFSCSQDHAAAKVNFDCADKQWRELDLGLQQNIINNVNRHNDWFLARKYLVPRPTG